LSVFFLARTDTESQSVQINPRRITVTAPTLLRRSFILVSAVAVAAGLILTACGDDSDGNGEASLLVVATLPLFADFTGEIGGERVEVEALLPSGSDPHTWEPAPQDVAKVEDADLIIANGLDLEPAAMSIIDANAGGTAVVLLAEEAIEMGAEIVEGEEHEEEEEEDHEHEAGNPHLWLNVENARLYVRAIRDALAKADPEGAGEYDANLQVYEAELDDVAGYVLETTAGVPAENRRLVTAHDAFGYLAEYIGYEVAAFLVTGPGQEVTPGDITRIQEVIEDEGVPAAFVEPQLSESLKDILEGYANPQDAGICTLYSDSLDDTVTGYIELMRFNADEIARCLGGADAG
jgi:ABC-type Zn uptake system ZnuABC Zn-binding protein ZnuA